MNSSNNVLDLAVPTNGLDALATQQVVCISHGFQSNYERGFCNGLASRGVALTLISSDRTDAANLDPRVVTQNLRGSQEESRPRWAKAVNLLYYHVALMVYVAYRHRSIAHVIGLIDPAFLCGIVEGLWFRLVSRRYVLTVHDLLPHDRHTFVNQLAYRLSFKIPHLLVVHTERMKADLVGKFGIRAEKIVVMEHGIEPNQPSSADFGDAREAGALPVILVFGKIAPYKGVDLLIEALRSVSFDFRLVIAGSCPNAEFRQRLQTLIADQGFRDRVEWQDGFVAESEMERLMKAADLLALPYRHIDQSGVLFQALRFGVPVLATRVGQFAHYVSEEVGEIAEPENVADLGAALERWFARRGSLLRSRIRAIGQRYEWPATVSVLRQVYQ